MNNMSQYDRMRQIALYLLSGEMQRKSEQSWMYAIP